MTTTSKPAHRALASLKLPNKVPALITYAQSIVKAMTGNPVFPTPTPALATVTEAINELQAAETSALARTKGAVAVRNEKRAALVALLQQLRGHIQATADASPETAGSVIRSADATDEHELLRATKSWRNSYCADQRRGRRCANGGHHVVHGSSVVPKLASCGRIGHPRHRPKPRTRSPPSSAMRGRR